jgi:adenylate cyclase
MTFGNLTSRLTRPWLSGGIATALTAFLGLGLFVCNFGRDLTRLSYDLPFLVRSEMAAPDVGLVFLDEASHADLMQPTAAPWDRSLHARLIDRLTADGAKAIVFDILFTEASAHEEADAELERAMKQSGRVILGANLNGYETEQGYIVGEELPYERFRTAAAGWGNVNFRPDPDYGVRAFFSNLHDISGQTNVLWLPWAAASFAAPAGSLLFPSLTTGPRLNFYGPPGTIPGVSYSRALLGDVAPGFFKNKIVFVGAKMSAGLTGQDRDVFRTPYTYWGKGFMPGVEVHATAALNLLHRNWLTRLPGVAEVLLVLTVAGLAGFGLMRLQPLVATGATLLALVAIPSLAVILVWHYLAWFSWLVLVAQVAAAWLCSIVFNSLALYVDKQVLERSLASHLSPKLVKRMVKEPALRQLGGTKQEVGILFTDIANFSRISETMPPDELVHLLNRYFEITLNCVREADGTVVKLIGDAIFAIWNAPLAQPDYRERACQAALRLHEQLVDFEAEQRSLPLRTRVGLHAGTACVGNVGSFARFDYTALGENINLTSRLEGLNKYVSTSVLASRDIQRVAENALVWRAVGRFTLVGISRPVEVFELLGRLDSAERSKPWRTKFAEALCDFQARQFDTAAAKFQAAIDLRRAIEPEFITGTGPTTADGPSCFYLSKIDYFRAHPPAQDWLGEVELTDK